MTDPTKKQPSPGEIRETIATLFGKGRSGTEILAELVRTLGLDARHAAFFISTFPRPDLKARYARMNQILFGLLAVLTILRVLPLLSIASSVKPQTVVGTVVVAAFAFGVMHYRGHWYKPLALVAFGWLGGSVPRAMQGDMGALLETLLGGAIFLLSGFLGFRLFPTFGFLNARKTREGTYQV